MKTEQIKDKHIKFLIQLIADEEAMAETINLDSPNAEIDCYKIHQENILNLNVCLREILALREKVAELENAILDTEVRNNQQSGFYYEQERD